ncbi:azurin [Aeromonas simiae]|uniref:azurin n=1 Tax=Aeromonas simiae TaxID=218936 RepID=UPI0005A8F31E|nr:azurin [Aeromonas simiae]MDO2948088.1 azurin [Aeromonas simiae]MDO2952827.1 azurin [Aeromonas simiae]MDO2955493.1 azurin [Aeromonas simiae]
MRYAIPFLLLGVIAAPVLAADACSLTIEADDAMKFSTDAMSVPASCQEVTVTLKHVGKLPVTAMGHNWVLAATADLQGVATDGMSAGAASGYLKEGDPRVIAHTQLIGGGESSSVTFPAKDLAGKDLSFFCSFPGHWAIMKGSFKLG